MGDIRTSGLGGTPFGDTSSRPSSPSVGQTYYNGQLGYLEIYTVSGWIPATGANDFSLNITGTNTTVTFSQSYSSGSYSIVSFLNDAAIDIYAYNGDGTLAGYTNTKAFTATQRFNKMVILGGSYGDVLQFSYKTTYATSASTTDVLAGPYITSITPSGMPNKDDTITVTGGNFATDITAAFTGTGYSSTPAKSIVRSSSTQLIVTRPDNFPTSGSPYTITVTNPSVLNQPVGSAVHQYSGVTSGAVPVWQTSSSQIITTGLSYSLSLVATDVDGGSTLAYSNVSGSLPSGITFNSSTGIISGTTSSTGSFAYTVRATDSGGNTADLTINFTASYPVVAGGTLTSDSTYYYRTFTGNATLGISSGKLNCDILMVGGGGGAGKYSGGGAGSEVLTISRLLDINSYPITIGSGGAGQPGAQYGWNDSRHGSPTTGFGETCKPGGGGKNADDRRDAGSTVSEGIPPDNGYDTRVANGGGGSSRSAGYFGTLGTSIGSGVTRYGGYRGGQTLWGDSSTNQSPNYPGAGGAGAGGGITGDTGSQTSRNSMGDGAPGVLSNISGSSLYWAAGGGGTVYYANGGAGGGNGGIGGGGGGGGGSGSSGTATPGSGGGSAYNSGGAGQSGGSGVGGNGGQNTGSGGGAGRGETEANGGSGGSGIVVVRYLKASVGG